MTPKRIGITAQTAAFGRSLRAVFGLLALTGLILTSTPNPAHAMGGLVGGFLSDALKALCNGPPRDPAACVLWFIQDPVGDITHIQETIDYNPALITIDLANSGFLCDFSSNGSCPALAPNTLDSSNTPLMPGGPRANTTYSLTVGPDTVTLDYDLSNNPVMTSGEDFFALGFSVSPDVTGFTFNSSPGPADLFQASFTCTTLEGTGCGSEHPGFGIVAVVPEPGSLALISIGLLVLGSLRWRESSDRLNFPFRRFAAARRVPMARRQS